MQAIAGLAHYGAQFAGSAFVAGLWQGTLLAAAVWLCLRLVPRATAALRFALWTAVLLMVAVLPLLQSASIRSAQRSPLKLDLRWSVALACLWLALSLVRVVSLAWHSCRLWTLHRQAVPVPPPPAVEALLATTRRTVQLCTSHRVERPGVIGFFAPRILIPAWLYPQLTAPELEQIVLHELEHLRRRDDWLNLLQKVALVLFPLNPILIAVERLLCLERELACDDGVLRRTRAPRLYATCLATLAERGLDHRASSLALGALGEPKCRSELSRRIQRILRRQIAASPLHARALTVAVGVVLVGGTLGLARCPQLVAFVPATPAMAAAVPTNPRPAQMEIQTMRVVYTDSQSAKARYAEAQSAPRLLRVSYALQRKPRTAHVRRQRPIPSPQAQVQVQKQPLAPETSLLLTGWPEQDRPHLLTLGADLPTTGRFAVVRVEDGWLLVQL